MKNKMKKICINCKQEYETFQNKSKYCCVSCKNSYNTKNKKNKHKNSLILKWVKKTKAIEFLGGKCNNCGDKNIFHLVFHHNNVNDKEYTISKLWNNRWSVIEEEINKCSLLCDNCHRELHYNDKENEERRQTKELIIKYKGNKCEICGYDKCIAALIFHHKNDDKNYEIAKNSIRITNINDLTNDIIVELNKCELLCSNCHSEKHIDIEKFDIEEILKKKETYKETNKKINREKVFKMFFEENLSSINISKSLNHSRNAISEIIKEEKKKRNKEY